MIENDGKDFMYRHNFVLTAPQDNTTLTKAIVRTWVKEYVLLDEGVVYLI